MRLFLAFDSALSYWRSANQIPTNLRDRHSINPDSVSCITAKEAEWLGERFGMTPPYSIAAYASKARRNSSKLHCRLHEKSLPANEYIHLGKETYVASPELTIAQTATLLKDSSYCPLLANSLSMDPDFARSIVLAVIATELCGTYRLDSSMDGFHSAKPITTVKKLASFLERTGGFQGRQIMQMALSLCEDLSNSPSETALSMMTRAPYKFGGYGLSKAAKLNYGINTTSLGRNTTRYADLCWPDEKIVIEYSGSYHEGERANKDDLRRIELEAQGYFVTTINSDQLHNLPLLDEAISVAAKQIERTGRKPGNYTQRKKFARALIFEANGTRCKENQSRFINERLRVLSQD